MTDNFLQRDMFLNFMSSLESTLEREDPEQYKLQMALKKQNPVKYRTQMHDLMVDSCQSQVQDNYPQ